MPDDHLIELSEDVLSIPPLVFRLIRKKLTETLIPDSDLNITPLQFEILKLLEKENTMHISEIGVKLQVAKAQMTKLIDGLEVLNFVERKASSADRRITNISLTGKVRGILQDDQNKVLLAIAGSMQSLSRQDLETLSISLRNIRTIMQKVL
jgi:DNA-binding MarR family transcriptional regulator